jgi:hypothetical protein
VSENGRSAAPISPALQAAQERLMALRRRRRQQRQAQGLPIRTEMNGRFPASDPLPAHSPSPPPAQTLPDHLGWESSAVTQALRRREATAAAATGEPNEARPAPPAVTPPPPVAPESASSPSAAAPTTLRLYPALAVGMLRAGEVAAGRIWLLLRHLDPDGRGWVTVKEARRRLTGKSARWRVCGWRQMRNLLRRGEGTFWRRRNGRIWLRSTVRVAAALEVWRLTGRPVGLKVSILTQGIGAVRAHFYASFHSGRNGPEQQAAGPIARDTLHTITDVHPRTQRRYERQAQVGRRTNYAIGPQLNARDQQREAWERGAALFPFTDERGQHGRPGETYLAWQLPNQYVGPHPQRSRRCQKRLNRALADLFNQGITGNDENSRYEKCFHGNGKVAARAYNRDPHQDRYWPAPQAASASTLQASAAGNGRFWYCLRRQDPSRSMNDE